MAIENHVSNSAVTKAVIDIAYDEEVVEPDWAQIYTDDLDVKLAREKWQLAKKEIKLNGGHVNRYVGHQIKQLVIFHVILEGASRHIAEEGAVKKARRSKMPQYNPWFSVLRDTTKMLNDCEKKLGISQEKTKAGSGQEAKTAKGRAPRKADAYLGRPHRNAGRKVAGSA